MRLTQLQWPLKAAVSGVSLPHTANCLFYLRASRLPPSSSNALVEGRRHASVKAQGKYKYFPKRTHPKKLGAKRTGDQYVIPGNIIYKQRGTLWWPGENCIMGRDHTIHAAVSGYVKYYRDPLRHPDRKYIGVTFQREDKLPYPQHAERKRRLGMATFPIKKPEPIPELSASGIPNIVKRIDPHRPEQAQILRLREDYSYREDNWRIGRIVKTKGLQIRRFRSRRAFLRHRRWAREKGLAGEKKAAEKRAQEGDEEWVEAARAKTKAAKDKRAKKEEEKNKAKAARRRR